MIIYKHKQTGHSISLEELKKHMDGDILTFQKVDTLRAFNPYEELKPIEKYTYHIKNIPFSEDFEVIEIEEELNFNEMSYMLHLLKNERDFSDYAQKIMAKIEKKMDRLIKMERGL